LLTGLVGEEGEKEKKSAGRYVGIIGRYYPRIIYYDGRGGINTKKKVNKKWLMKYAKRL
jgi:hypothetical protein